MIQQGLRLAVTAMGTRFELVLAAGDCDLLAAGEAAVEEIETWHRRLSRFAPDSLVSHINREAWRAPVKLDRDTFELMNDAVNVWRMSEGAFDITVAPAMRHWGHADSAVPTRDGRIDGSAWRLDPGRWTLEVSGPHVSIDLGGIGKGHALDCAKRILREAGVTCALLHGGTSSVVAIGAPAGSDGWRVTVAGGRDARVVTLRNNAMSVSDASSGREHDGDHHIIDPRHGAPVPHAMRATVTGPSARLADAWSTALVVLGRTPAGFPTDYSAFIDAQEAALT